MPLVTAAQIKSFLQITSTEQDTLLGDLADRASAVAETYCDRKFGTASYAPGADPDNSLLDGQDLPFVYMPQWPIIAVTALKLVNEGGGTAIQTFTASQYAIHKLEGKILLLPSAVLQTARRDYVSRPVFPKGTQNVWVEYSAGYATIPADVQEAVILVAAHMFGLSDQRRLMAQSIAVGGGGAGGSSSFLIADMPPEAKGRLDRYKSPIPR